MSMIANSSTLYSYDVEKLKMERARQGKSIRRLADLAVVDPKTIIRIEKSEVKPRIQTIGRIAKALNKDITDFIREDQVGEVIEHKTENINGQ